jgi:hypothetical protein
MEQPDAAAVLDPGMVEFVHSGVLAGVATRDERLTPSLTRGWGPEVSKDGRSLKLCVPAAEGSRIRANLEGNGAIAVGFTPPTIARAVQVKGVISGMSEPDAGDLERVERHFGLFIEECERIGAPPHVPLRMIMREGLLVVRFEIDEIYDQTPGPTAGRRL